MELLEILFGTILAYLLGAIPTSLIISKFHFGIDIREHGNGEAAHDNVMRVLGWKASIMVRALDILKGFLAAQLAVALHHYLGFFEKEVFDILPMSFGLAAVLGHIFPVWAKFKGGKGVHAAIGVLLVLDPIISVISVAFGMLIWAITRYPNLAYVLGSAALLPLTLIFYRQEAPLREPLLIFSAILFIFLCLSHLENLREIFGNTSLKEDRKKLFN
jgi:glycerol-3-phosphate acyltransferase PlsY